MHLETTVRMRGLRGFAAEVSLTRLPPLSISHHTGPTGSTEGRTGAGTEQ